MWKVVDIPPDTRDNDPFEKLSAFVKYVIKFVSIANPITNLELVEEYILKAGLYMPDSGRKRLQR